MLKCRMQRLFDYLKKKCKRVMYMETHFDDQTMCHLCKFPTCLLSKTLYSSNIDC